MSHDRDPGGSGRTSRGSNVSGMSRAPGRQPQGANRPENLPHGAEGIMTMLRTGTEMGNVVGLTGDMSGYGSIPRAPPRRGTTSRLSTASSRSNHSSRAGRHHREYRSSSSGSRHPPVRDHDGPRFVADTLSPTMVNIPHLPPHHQPGSRHRGEHRSHSLTYSTQPTHQLSSNRSLNSLRSDHSQRPRSPYNYPPRVPRSGFASGSPNSTEYYGSQPRRHHGQGSQDQPYFPGSRNGGQGPMYSQTHLAYSQPQLPYGSQMNRGRDQPYDQSHQRLRVPSDSNIRQSSRAHGMPHHPRGGSSSTHHTELGLGVPPVPPLPDQYPAPVSNRTLRSSAQGSASSSLTRMRTDRGTPSSDMTFPPTPDGTSMEVLPSPNVKLMVGNGTTDSLNDENTRTPRFYGTEIDKQFERDQHAQSGDNIVRGIPGQHFEVRDIEGQVIETASRVVRIPMGTGHTPEEIRAILRLPDRYRLTTERIQQAIQLSPTTGDMGASGGSPALAQDSLAIRSEHTPFVSDLPTAAESAKAPLQPGTRQKRRQSTQSKTLTDAFDSSTANLALRYSEPTACGPEIGAQVVSKKTSKANSLASPEHSTGQQISEFLKGYQHTEERSESSPASGRSPVSKKVSFQLPDEKNSRETLRSSAEQSFKSAPDVLSEQEFSSNANGVRTSRTHGSVVARSRPASVLASRPLSPTLTRFATVHNRPVSQMHRSSTPHALNFITHRDEPRALNHQNAHEDLMSFYPKLRQKKTSGSASSSTSSVVQSLSSAPHRDSTTLTKTQKPKRMSSIFSRQSSRPSLFNRVRTRSTRERTVQLGGEDVQAEESSRSKENRADVAPSVLPTDGFVESPERLLNKSTAVSEEQAASPISTNSNGAAMSIRVRSNVNTQQRSLSSSAPTRQSVSSAFPPHVSSLASRTQSSATQQLNHQEHRRRESHTTTHIDWNDHVLRDMHSADVTGPGVPFSEAQEDTTTDLRLPSYRYPCGPDYLPAVKEESHEDSSLNTSASNLKYSRLKLPFSGRQSQGTWNDEVTGHSRLSTASHAQSALGSGPMQSRNLPSMDFSEMDLVEKVKQELGLHDPMPKDVLTESEEPKVPEDAVQLEVAVVAKPSPESYNSLPKESESEPKEFEKMLESTRAMSVMTAQQSPSRKTMATELDELRVPSVGTLGQNISRMLSPLRKKPQSSSDKGEFEEENEIMEHAMEEIREVGGPSQKRSSARLRPMPGSPHLVVMKDDVYEECYSKEKENNESSHPGDRAGNLSAGEAAFGIKTQSTTRTPTKPHPKAAPTAPKISTPPAATRRRALTKSNQDLRASLETPFPSLKSLRSLGSLNPTPTVTDTRPWNFDKNYPWTVKDPPIDIVLPPFGSGPHGTISNASKASSFSSADTAATASPFGTTSHSNTQVRRDPFSNLSRVGDQHHVAGERYPTSALTPPTAIFRDDSAAFDTSDDEDFSTTCKQRTGLRKRFSSARKANRRKAGPTVLASPESGELSINSCLRECANEAQAFTAKRFTFRNAEGMQSASYYRKKIVFTISIWCSQTAYFWRKITRRERPDYESENAEEEN